MARCPSCDYPLPEDRERLGARCPSCRDPLYDPPTRHARPVRTGEAACAVHPSNESIGTCGRCGNFYCETCRSRWADQILCLACVERGMDSGEGQPEQVRTHFRQALWSLLLGLGTWIVAVLGFVLVVVASAASGGLHLGALVLWVFLLLGLSVSALFGLGLGAAAIRVRGKHVILASCGLILSGLYVGALIGICTHTMW